jgi:hypothetical protein
MLASTVVLTAGHALAEEVTPAPEAPAASAPTTLTDADFEEIHKLLVEADDHRTMPDGSQHAMIDGNRVWFMLMQRRALAQRLAKAGAQQQADPDGAEAAKKAQSVTDEMRKSLDQRKAQSALPRFTRRPPVEFDPPEHLSVAPEPPGSPDIKPAP